MSDKGTSILERRFRITKTLTVADCPYFAGKGDGYPMIKNEEVAEGTIVYQYFGYTYGCVSGNGVAVTAENGQTPFLEIPRKYLEAV